MTKFVEAARRLKKVTGWWRTGELLAPMAVVGQLEVSGRWLHGERGGRTGYMRKGRRLQHKEAGAG